MITNGDQHSSCAEEALHSPYWKESFEALHSEHLQTRLDMRRGIDMAECTMRNQAVCPSHIYQQHMLALTVKASCSGVKFMTRTIAIEH